MDAFNENGAAIPESGIFGLPYSIEESKLVLIPAPWNATASKLSNSNMAPSAILRQSKYVELYDINLGSFYEQGISMEDIPSQLQKLNQTAKTLNKIDELCKVMIKHTFGKTQDHLNNNKFVGLIGGNHSVSLGSIKAHLEKYPQMGVLQIDAHCDLREKFEDFTYSHASVMFNVLQETKLKKLVQVGVRGLCEEEHRRTHDSNGRIQTFFDSSLQESKHQGKSWNQICDDIIATLPIEIYISFDIDGLEPSLCPHTGTPVPGGLTYQETIYLMKRIVNAGRKIVGFDLVEVTPGKDGDWDANVGAHLLYQLCGWCMRSNK